MILKFSVPLSSNAYSSKQIEITLKKAVPEAQFYTTNHTIQITVDVGISADEAIDTRKVIERSLLRITDSRNWRFELG